LLTLTRVRRWLSPFQELAAHEVLSLHEIAAAAVHLLNDEVLQVRSDAEPDHREFEGGRFGQKERYAAGGKIVATHLLKHFRVGKSPVAVGSKRLNGRVGPAAGAAPLVEIGDGLGRASGKRAAKLVI
jgi:hypothetical protein